eukprot:sb/3464435/
MAEHKYDLWTVPPTKKTPKHYPWYSERLRQKYLSSKPSGALLSSNWLFVKEGGDDYRTGIPRETMSAQPYLTKKDGTRPGALLPRLPPLDGQKPASAIMSRKVPRRKAQMEYINVIESGLTGHPLAVFPHYEEAVAPDVFEEIVDTLDPDMRHNSSSECSGSEDGGSGSEEGTASSQKALDSIRSHSSRDSGEQAEKSHTANCFKWYPLTPLTTYPPITPSPPLSSGEQAEKSHTANCFKWYPSEEPFDDNSSTAGPQERGSGHTKIQRVTKDFCDWVRDLGGDSSQNNIEESTVFSLFASGYETKPALSVPIHVVQLSDVPLELRNGAMVSPDLPSLLQYGVKNLTIKRGDTPHNANLDKQNHWIRHQYGAWYLPVDLWKHKNNPQGLSDPRADTMNTVSEAKLKSRELDSTLTYMHGAISFREYIDRKNLRRPDFLQTVEPPIKEETGSVKNVPSAKSLRGQSN